MKVSILIPCRNEEKFIAECLESVLAQDYSDKEILLVDGMSEDKTREIAGKYPEVKILDNEKKITSSALNIGIKNAAGEIIIRMDAHAKYEKNYVSKCVYYLNKYKADNVGGTIKTLASKNTIIAKAIAKSLSSFFGAGSSLFRTGTKECVWVDTVFGGCFKKGLFDKIGYFNENLIRSQDMEFNLRLKRFGGKILLTPDIISYYYPKSTLKDFFIHNIKDGVWAVYPIKFTKKPLGFRHYIPLIFTAGLLGSAFLSYLSVYFEYLFITILLLYLLASLHFSLKIAREEKNLKFIFALPIVFFARHIGYGLGSFFGIIKIICYTKTI